MEEESTQNDWSGVTFNEEDEEDVQSFELSERNLRIQLTTAENEFNAAKKTLFATYVWSGSKVIVDYLANEENSRELVVDKTVLELGAGAGLPSLFCAKLAAKRVCAADYPSSNVIMNLRRNVVRNGLTANVSVREHIWGEDVSPLLKANGGEQFDVVVASECLWRHECHSALLTTVLNALKPGGYLVLTYSHHIPGLEKDDDNFLALADQAGLQILSTTKALAPNMWNPDQMKEITLVKLQKPC
jgi:nicotinamide N-methyltransferase